MDVNSDFLCRKGTPGFFLYYNRVVRDSSSQEDYGFMDEIRRRVIFCVAEESFTFYVSRKFQTVGRVLHHRDR